MIHKRALFILTAATCLGHHSLGLAQNPKTLVRGRPNAVSVKFSPDGESLAAAYADMTIKLWDVRSHKIRATLRGHIYNVASLSFSPDGKTLASGGYRAILLWDVSSGKMKRRFECATDSVASVAYSPDGKLLASAHPNGIVKLWDVKSGKAKELKGHKGQGLSVTFSPDGKTLASGALLNIIKLWDVKSVALQGTLFGPGECLTYSHDGKLLAGAAMAFESKIALWDARTYVRKPKLNPEKNSNYLVAFSPDDKYLISAVGGKPIGMISLWNVATRKQEAVFKGHTDSVTSLDVSPDGALLASGSEDYTLKLWRIATRQEIATLKDTSGKFPGSVASLAVRACLQINFSLVGAVWPLVGSC